jgi:excisionase family DNA binding protein
MTETEIELPTEAVAEEARRALRPLAALVRQRRFDRVLVRAQRDREIVEVKVPRAAYSLFLEVLTQLSNGNAVTIVPIRAELTTQEAADLLNCSRPHVVHLMEEGVLPFRKVGTHRRVFAADVLAYRRKDDERRREIARELTEAEN